MIEAGRRRLDESFAVRGTEEDRIRDLEARLQRLRLADRFATRSLAMELAERFDRRSMLDRRLIHVAAGGPGDGPALRDAGRWRGLRAIWRRLVR
jgi:hypothetical protein